MSIIILWAELVIERNYFLHNKKIRNFFGTNGKIIAIRAKRSVRLPVVMTKDEALKKIVFFTGINQLCHFRMDITQPLKKHTGSSPLHNL